MFLFIESVTDLESLWKTIAIQGSIYEELDSLDKMHFVSLHVYKQLNMEIFVTC